MVKCEGVTYGYTKYVQFIHSNNFLDDSWIAFWCVSFGSQCIYQTGQYFIWSKTGVLYDCMLLYLNILCAILV